MIEIPDMLRAMARWILWRRDLRAGKLPLPWYGGMAPASAFDSRNQMPFDAALHNLRLGLMQGSWERLAGGLGFVFTGEPHPELGIIGGVDLDGVVNPDNGHLAAWAAEIVCAFDTYTEISPSGGGLHLYAGGAPERLARTGRAMERGLGDPIVEGKPPFLESYVRDRFFTVTGRRWPPAPTEVACRPKAWAWLVEHHLGGTVASRSPSAAGRYDDPELEVVAAALATFTSDDVDRGTWIGIGEVIKQAFGEDGGEVWHAWMAKSPNDESDVTARIWDGLSGEPHSMTLGTVFWLARQHGWIAPWRERVPAWEDFLEISEAPGEVALDGLIARLEKAGEEADEGMGLRWSFMGPFETIDLNIRGGVGVHAARLGAAYARIGAERDPLTPELVDRVVAARRDEMPLQKWDERRAWRDRMLMAMVRAKRDAQERFGR